MTLIELLVTLCVLAILASIATPSFSALIIKQRSQADLEGTLALIQFARLSAVHEQQLVTLCAGNPATGCTTDWQSGLLVLTGHPNLPFHTDRVVQELAPPHNSQWKGNVARFVFNETGTLSGQSGSLLLCQTQGKRVLANRVIINRGGRTRVESQTNNESAQQLCNQPWRH